MITWPTNPSFDNSLTSNFSSVGISSANNNSASYTNHHQTWKFDDKLDYSEPKKRKRFDEKEDQAILQHAAKYNTGNTVKWEDCFIEGRTLKQIQSRYYRLTKPASDITKVNYQNGNALSSTGTVRTVESNDFYGTPDSNNIKLVEDTDYLQDLVLYDGLDLFGDDGSVQPGCSVIPSISNSNAILQTNMNPNKSSINLDSNQFRGSLQQSLSNNVSQIASKSPAHRFIVDSCFNYQEIKSPKSIDDIISMAFVTFINRIPRSSMVAIAEHLNPHPNTLPSHHKKLASLIMEFLDEDSFHSKTDCLDHLSNTNPFFDDFFSSSPYNQSTSINPTETTPMCYELREESMEILLKEGLERFTMNHTNQAVSSDIYNLNYVKNFAPEHWGKSQRITNSPICKR